MPRTVKEIKVASAAKSAASVLEKRAKDDLLLLEIIKPYQASLELAAKKCHEALRHIESYSLGFEFIPPLLAETRRATILAINLIVRTAISNQRKKSYVTKKDAAARENLISERKKLENDNFQRYKCSDDDLDVGCQSSTG